MKLDMPAACFNGALKSEFIMVFRLHSMGHATNRNILFYSFGKRLICRERKKLSQQDLKI